MEVRSECLQIHKITEHGNVLSPTLINIVKGEIRRIVKEVRITDGVINGEMKGSLLDYIESVYRRHICFRLGLTVSWINVWL
jgi:hypothetical protein